MSEKPLNLDTSENQVIDLFVKSWRAKSSDECNYPFTEQNNWTGTAVMEFMLFTLREFKQRIQEAVQGLEEGIKRCIECAECQTDLSREDILEQLREDIETEIKKWFPDVFKEVKEK